MNVQAGTVEIDYTNWRGERRQRQIVPLHITWTSTEHHNDPQWLLLAYDPEKRETRYFAMMNIHGWRPVL
jgi:predicted DNA-binding transcriptional regulator YafY